jgi:single-strand DNA-binding protein
MINKVILVGRLTKDPEIRYTAQNVPVVSFTIAVSRPFVNQTSGEREADFIPVVLWRKQAETVKKYLTKGALAGVEGRIQRRTYEGVDGQKRYVTEVLADNVYFLESKGNPETDSSFPKAPEMNQQVSNKKNDDDDYSYNNNVSFTDDDVPF